MASIFPTAVATTGNIPDTNPLTSLSANNHSGKHNQMRDEIIALETKVGANGSADNTSMDYKLGEIVSGDKAVGKSIAQTLLNKILGVGTAIKLASAAIGDMFYTIDVNGTLAKLGIGTNGQALLSNGTAPYWGSISSLNTNYGTDTGAANAYVVNPSVAIGSYTGGLQVQFIAANANTTASTVNVSGLGVKTIKKLDGATDLSANDIKVGMLVCIEYNATSGFFQMVNPVGNAPLLPNGDGSLLTNTPYYANQLFSTGNTLNNVIMCGNINNKTSLFMLVTTIAGSAYSIYRFTLDTATNQYFYSGDAVSGSFTGSIAVTQGVSYQGMTTDGTFVYVVATTNTPDTYLLRFSATNLAGGATAMTFSGTKPSTASNYHSMCSDGTNLYIYSTGTTWYKYTISGTTATNAATLTGPSVSYCPSWSDGTYIYTWDGGNLVKYALTLGSAISTTPKGTPGISISPVGISYFSGTVINLLGSYLSGNQGYITPFAKP